MQKIHHFGKFKDYKSRRKKETRQISPFFSSTFWALTVCGIHFCIWKLSKFINMGSSLCSILVCKIPEFWRWKLWDQNFIPLNSGNLHIKESKKLSFTFSIELRFKFVWRHGLDELGQKVLKIQQTTILIILSKKHPDQSGRNLSNFWWILIFILHNILIIWYFS